MDITYRRCRKKDLLPSAKLMTHTSDNLRVATGKKPFNQPVRRSPGLEHLFKQDKENFWCAWDGKKIVGFTAALNRGKQWYLAFLFVHPRYQDKKIGKELLKRVWRTGPGVTHALATFAFNMQAVGIYSKFGMTPICGLPLLEVTADKLVKPNPTGLVVKTNITRNDLAWINTLENKIRGYPHPQEWEFWRKFKDVQIRLFKDGDKLVGYSMISKKGAIAPAGAISNKYLSRVIAETINQTQLKKKDALRLWCPANNIDLYQFLIHHGFRCQEMELFMSDKAYPDFFRYVPAQLAVF
jgi:GNAT superfamily N-acetyltransferase